MTQRQHAEQLLNLLRYAADGSCANRGMGQENCLVCPCSRANNGPCGTSEQPFYRARKLDCLVKFMRAKGMQDLLDANQWVLTRALDEDAYYASLPL